MSNKITIEQLFDEINVKIKNNEQGSYSSFLAAGGVEKITRKIGEEALEVVIAAFLDKQENSAKTREDLIGEVCDLLYHILVLLVERNIEIDDLLQVLTERNSQNK